MLNHIRLKKFQIHLRAIAVIALLIAVGAASSGSTQAAAPAQSITISPTSIDQSVQPGSINNGSFEIINSGSTNYTFHVYATPYRVIGEDYDPDFTALPGAPNITSWFQFSSTAARIGVKQVVTVDYSIHVPAGTPAGGYYAVAFAQTQAQPSSTTGVVVADRVGEIFYLRVAGNAKQAGKLLTWQTSFLQKPPIQATVRVEDSGAYNFPATIDAQVKNVFGRVVYSFTTTRQVLPQTIRRIDIPWAATPSIGLFKVSGTVTLLGHTSQLSTKYVLVVSQTIRLVLLGLVILLLPALIYRRFRTRRHGKNYRH